MRVFTDLVVSGLAELADADYQALLWAGQVPQKIGSLFECTMAIFEDSGLSDALAQSAVYGQKIDDNLRELQSLLESIDPMRSERDILADPRLPDVRQAAARALSGISSLGLDAGDVREVRDS